MKLFGILNITPDSFSDGDKFMGVEAAAAHARQMMAQGAYAIDIGAESTRPGAQALTSKEELQRLLPVLDVLDVPVSIDTYHHETAAEAVRYKNVKYINDVSGFNDVRMLEVAKKSGCEIIVMHSLTVPADKAVILKTPPVETMLGWIEGKYTSLISSGIAPEKIIFDPGVGFNKNAAQSLELVERASELAEECHKLGCRILYGHSRKSFLGGDVALRDAETARLSAQLQSAGVDYIRVHNIEINQKAINGGSY